MDLSIVIPCYNEADNVQKLESEFFPVAAELARSRSVEIVFVDDGSLDGTWPALTENFGGDKKPGLAIKFEKHAVNRGLGAAIRTGFAASTGEIVVTTDSDGTYKFSEIPAMLARLAPDVDMVTASPYHPQGGIAGVPAYRLILSQGSSILYRILVSWRVHTYTALFRAYRRKVVETVPFESNGFLAGTEILVGGMLRGYKVAEHPAVLHSRVFGVSKAKIMRTIRAHLQFQWRILLHRLGFVSLVNRRDTVGAGAS
ncbi:MAG: glycosyltransferase family 2 protein [Chloroflexi bacterium]|nr:glycosyltransferase family 2 protein [Chloroflexota bacterium]